MRKTTKGHGLPGAAVTAVLVAVLAMLFAGFLLAACFGGGETDTLATGLVTVYALLCLAVAIGVIAALIQRWREVRGGEEDEAKKY